MNLLVSLLKDSDPEVRAQAAKVLGENHWSPAFGDLVRALQDESPRARFFAAMALGKLSNEQAVPAVLAFLRENNGQDPYLRHAGVMALTRLGSMPDLLKAARDDSAAVRMGALLAMRRRQRPEIALFLHDSDPDLVLEAARAINDEPINGAMPDLTAFLSDPQFSKVLANLAAETSDPDRSGMPSPELVKEALIRRALNASFHLGTAASAHGLVQYASNADAPPNMRVEALEELGDWEHPSGRDRVIGLWRPVAAVRPAQTAAQALEPKLADLLKSAPAGVEIALLKTVGRLDMISADDQVVAVATNPKAGGAVRATALETLAALRSPQLEAVVNRAQHDSNEDLRRAALSLEARMKYASSISHLAAVLESGSIGEQQTALAGLSTIPGDAVDQIILQWLDRLRSGTVPKELELDLLDAARKRSSVRVERRLARYESTLSKRDPLAPYQEALFGGDAEAGRKIFFERQETQCVRCHKIGGEGGDVGPDLTHIGAQKDRRYLLESVILPNQQIAPGFESVTVTLKNGNSYAGVLKSENANEVVLNSADTGHLTLKKSDIESRRASLSPMPEGFGQIVSKHDLRDLVEFLATRK